MTCFRVPNAALALSTGVCLLGLAACIPSVANEQAAQRPMTLAAPTWQTLASPATARGGSVVAEVGGKIYVIGGANTVTVGTVEEYDIATDSWTNCGGTCASMPFPVSAAAGGAQDGLIFVFAGVGASPATLVQVYDPVANDWLSQTSPTTACNGNACDAVSTLQESQSTAASNGGLIYLMGGNAGPNGTVSLFDSAAAPGTMFSDCVPTSCILPFSSGRSRMASVFAGTSIYAYGGYDGGPAGGIASLFQLDTVAGVWTNCGGVCPDGNVPGMDGVMGYNNGILWVIAVNSNSAGFAVQAFDTLTNTWTNCGSTCPSVPTPVGGPGWIQIGNQVHLFGGSDGTSAVNLHQVVTLP